MFEAGDPPTYTDIVFQGVAAHYLLGEVIGTILFDIEEVPVSAIIDAYRDLFERTQRHGWPLGGAALDELPAYAQRQGLRAYQINTSHGLVEGWVWAQRMELRTRAGGWVATERQARLRGMGRATWAGRALTGAPRPPPGPRPAPPPPGRRRRG